MKRWWLLAIGAVALGWFIWPGRGQMPSIYQVGTDNRYLVPVFSGADITKNLRYGTNERLELDLYQPTGDTLEKRPVVVLVHGGGFVAGSKEGVAAAAEELAKRGYVALAINYRLTGAGQGFSITDPQLSRAVRDAQHDAMAAVRWARKNAVRYRLDPERIGMGGYSAGAMTSLYVDFNHNDAGNSGNPGFSSNIKAVFSMAGAVLPDDFNLITGDDFPVIMLHGEDDEVVPYAYAVQTANRISAAGIPYEFHHYPGVRHAVGNNPDARQKTYAFLYKYLVGGGPAVSPGPSPSPPASPPASPPPPSPPASPPPPSPPASPPPPSPSPGPAVSPTPSPSPSPSPGLGGTQPDTGAPTWLTLVLALSAGLLTLVKVLLY